MQTDKENRARLLDEQRQQPEHSHQSIASVLRQEATEIQEERVRILDENRRRQEDIRSQSAALRLQKEAERNDKRWHGFLQRPFVEYPHYSETHKQLLYEGQRQPPEKVGGTVTHFTDWIYSLYIPSKSEDSLRRGRDLEGGVINEKMKPKDVSLYDKGWIPVPAHADWALIYNGMSPSENVALKISALKINQAPIFGKPDLVFQETSSGTILIVEIKISEAIIPDGGWPNLRAQLWAYSKIDNWARSSDTLLVGEIWGFNEGLRLRRAMRWRPQELEQENMQLFDLYTSHM